MSDSPEHTSQLEQWAKDFKRGASFDEAQRRLESELEVRRFGSSPHAFIHTLSDLATLYILLGKYDKADSLLEEGRQLYLRGLEKRNTSFLALLEATSQLDQSRGFYLGAYLLQAVVVEITKALYGPEHPLSAAALCTRARWDMNAGHLDDAESALEEAFRIFTKAGVTGPALTGYLMAKGTLLLNRREYAGALTVLKHCLNLLPSGSDEEVPSHRDAVLRDLAAAYTGTGCLREAAMVLTELVQREVPLQDAKSPLAVLPLSKLALTYGALGEWDLAMAFAREAESLWQNLADTSLWMGTDEERSALSDTLRGAGAPSLALFLTRAAEDSFARECLQMVWRRKGIATARLVMQQRELHRSSSPAVRSLFAEWQRLQTQIAATWLQQRRAPAPDGGQEYESEIYRLLHRSSQIEKQIAAQLWTNGASSPQDNSLAAVAARLPAQSVLIEYVRAERFDATAYRNQFAADDAYFAFVMSASEPSKVHFHDLGSAIEIDRLIAQIEVRIMPGFTPGTGPNDGTLRELLQALESRLLTPLGVEPGAIGHLVIVPDSEIARVPFAALRDRHGTYLCDRYLISYANNATEIETDRTRPPESAKPAAAIVFANPDFAAGSSGTASTTEVSGFFPAFLPLPHSLREAVLLAEEIGPETELWLGEQATKQRLLDCRSPEILHLATHAYVLPDETSTAVFELDHPYRQASLLCSGIALAGAETYSRNHLPLSTFGNGLATALEVAAMDLYGTELVVLSACRSGLGAVRTGEAVYGLRRSFFVAGARRLLTSLWAVSDAHTTDLMAEFYRHLKRGHSPVSALAAAQSLIRLMAPHPFYWASFALYGSPRPWL